MTPFRRAVLLVAALNLAYFAVEFAVALAIGSVALFADSVDFLEDTSLNLLIFLAAVWSPRARGRVGALLAAVLLVPSLAALWTAWDKLWHFVPPGALPLTVTGGGALVVNVAAAFLIAPFRKNSGGLGRAAWFSARNDAIANAAIIAAGGVTAWTLSAWPDLLAGLGIAVLNAGAAREVLSAARKEGEEEPPVSGRD